MIENAKKCENMEHEKQKEEIKIDDEKKWKKKYSEEEIK